MKTAICSQGEGLSSPVDSRFGRCNYLVIVDTESGEVESVPNPAVASAHGAGPASVQFLSSKGVEAVLAQNVGPNAYSALEAAGISLYSMGGNTVGEVLEEFKKGLLSTHRGATVGSHSGMRRF